MLCRTLDPMFSFGHLLWKKCITLLFCFFVSFFVSLGIFVLFSNLFSNPNFFRIRFFRIQFRIRLFWIQFFRIRFQIQIFSNPILNSSFFNPISNLTFSNQIFRIRFFSNRFFSNLIFSNLIFSNLIFWIRFFFKSDFESECCFPFRQSYFIKLFDAGLQCEFIRTFF